MSSPSKKPFRKIILLTESDEEELELESSDDDIRIHSRPSTRAETSSVTANAQIVEQQSTSKGGIDSTKHPLPLPQLPSPPFTTVDLANSYKILNYIHTRNEKTGFTDFRQWLNQYSDPRGKKFQKVDGRGIQALKKWAEEVISSHVKSRLKESWPVNPPPREKEAALANLPPFFFTMLNDAKYRAEWESEAFALIDAVNGKKVTEDVSEDETVVDDAKPRKSKKARRMTSKNWISYTIVEKPSSSSEISCTLSAAYAGVTREGYNRADCHFYGITKPLGHKYMQNPGLYASLNESLAGGRDIFFINVLPDFTLTEAAAYTVEALMIAFFKLLPQCNNRFRGSYTCADNPLLNALAKSGSDFLAKCGCVLWLRRVRSLDIFTPPLVIANPVTPLGDCIMLRELNKAHSDVEEYPIIDEEPPKKK